MNTDERAVLRSLSATENRTRHPCSSASSPPHFPHRDLEEPCSGIHDVRVIALGRVPDERGTILHMLRADDPHFRGFGEIYFSTIYRDVVKGWHRHREMTLNYVCVSGRIKLVMHDDRPHSPTRGMTQEEFLGPDRYALVQIPPGVWNGFKGMTDPHAIVANCCTHAHEPEANRTERLDPFDTSIPYDWGVRCH